MLKYLRPYMLSCSRLDLRHPGHDAAASTAVRETAQHMVPLVASLGTDLSSVVWQHDSYGKTLTRHWLESSNQDGASAILATFGPFRQAIATGHRDRPSRQAISSGHLGRPSRQAILTRHLDRPILGVGHDRHGQCHLRGQVR